VGSVEVFAGVLTSEKVNVLDYLKFESIALIGNALGGFFFVALLKYRAFVSNVG
jgi:formate/nitrite transporter FocA (FNT family)